MSIETNIKKLVIPFIYVYSLSLALIFMSAFLIANSHSKSISYAQSENYLSDNIVSINLSSANEMSIIENEPQIIDICENDIVKKIDGYFSSKSYKDMKDNTLYNSPLANHGCDFYKHAIENDIDPTLVAAISICETGAGVNSKEVDGQESYNAWGWGVMDSTETTENANAFWCDSWEHCIGRVSRGIKRNSDERSLSTHPEDIVLWYNPGSVNRAGGVPSESTWTKCVVRQMEVINNYSYSE